MSPPDTNIEKQERRHRPALLGIAISLSRWRSSQSWLSSF